MTPAQHKARGPVMGRPRKDPEDLLIPYSIRLTRSDIEKLARIGRPRLRQWIAKEKA